MWTCRHCGKKFDQFDDDVYTEGSKHFCSLECFENYQAAKVSDGMAKKIKSDADKQYYKKITDFIFAEYPKANPGMIGQQIKLMMQEFNITYQQLWEAMYYAQKYENHPFDKRYGMRQYDPYILPSIRYKAQVERVKQTTAKLITEEPAPTYRRMIKPIFLDEEENLDDDDV